MKAVSDPSGEGIVYARSAHFTGSSSYGRRPFGEIDPCIKTAVPRTIETSITFSPLRFPETQQLRDSGDEKTSNSKKDVPCHQKNLRETSITALESLSDNLPVARKGYLGQPVGIEESDLIGIIPGPDLQIQRLHLVTYYHDLPVNGALL